MPAQVAEYALEDELSPRGGLRFFNARKARGRRVVLALCDAADPAMRARTAAALSHERATSQRIRSPAVVSVLECGEDEGRPYAVYEWVKAQSVEAALWRGPLPLVQICSVASSLAAALQSLARAGVVHRHICPRTVLLCSDGSARLTGLGGCADAGGTAVIRPDWPDVRYVAPEQLIAAQDCHPAGDAYSVGAVLYAMSAGRPPYEATSPAALIKAANSPPGQLSHEGLDRLVRAGLLVREPSQRLPAELLVERVDALQGALRPEDHLAAIQQLQVQLDEAHRSLETHPPLAIRTLRHIYVPDGASNAINQRVRQLQALADMAGRLEQAAALPPGSAERLAVLADITLGDDAPSSMHQRRELLARPANDPLARLVDLLAAATAGRTVDVSRVGALLTALPETDRAHPAAAEAAQLVAMLERRAGGLELRERLSAALDRGEYAAILEEVDQLTADGTELEPEVLTLRDRAEALLMMLVDALLDKTDDILRQINEDPVGMQVRLGAVRLPGADTGELADRLAMLQERCAARAGEVRHLIDQARAAAAASIPAALELLQRPGEWTGQTAELLDRTRRELGIEADLAACRSEVADWLRQRKFQQAMRRYLRSGSRQELSEAQRASIRSLEREIRLAEMDDLRERAGQLLDAAAQGTAPERAEACRQARSQAEAFREKVGQNQALLPEADHQSLLAQANALLERIQHAQDSVERARGLRRILPRALAAAAVLLMAAGWIVYHFGPAGPQRPARDVLQTALVEVLQTARADPWQAVAGPEPQSDLPRLLELIGPAPEGAKRRAEWVSPLVEQPDGTLLGELRLFEAQRRVWPAPLEVRISFDARGRPRIALADDGLERLAAQYARWRYNDAQIAARQFDTRFEPLLTALLDELPARVDTLVAPQATLRPLLARLYQIDQAKAEPEPAAGAGTGAAGGSPAGMAAVIRLLPAEGLPAWLADLPELRLLARSSAAPSANPAAPTDPADSLLLEFASPTPAELEARLRSLLHDRLLHHADQLRQRIAQDLPPTPAWAWSVDSVEPAAAPILSAVPRALRITGDYPDAPTAESTAQFGADTLDFALQPPAPAALQTIADAGPDRTPQQAAEIFAALRQTQPPLDPSSDLAALDWRSVKPASPDPDALPRWAAEARAYRSPAQWQATLAGQTIDLYARAVLPRQQPPGIELEPVSLEAAGQSLLAVARTAAEDLRTQIIQQIKAAPPAEGLPADWDVRIAALGIVCRLELTAPAALQPLALPATLDLQQGTARLVDSADLALRIERFWAELPRSLAEALSAAAADGQPLHAVAARTSAARLLEGITHNLLLPRPGQCTIALEPGTLPSGLDEALVLEVAYDWPANLAPRAAGAVRIRSRVVPDAQTRSTILRAARADGDARPLVDLFTASAAAEPLQTSIREQIVRQLAAWCSAGPPQDLPAAWHALSATLTARPLAEVHSPAVLMLAAPRWDLLEVSMITPADAPEALLQSRIRRTWHDSTTDQRPVALQIPARADTPATGNFRAGQDLWDPAARRTLHRQLRLATLPARAALEAQLRQLPDRSELDLPRAAAFLHRAAAAKLPAAAQPLSASLPPHAPADQNAARAFFESLHNAWADCGDVPASHFVELVWGPEQVHVFAWSADAPNALPRAGRVRYARLADANAWQARILANPAAATGQLLTEALFTGPAAWDWSASEAGSIGVVLALDGPLLLARPDQAALPPRGMQLASRSRTVTRLADLFHTTPRAQWARQESCWPVALWITPTVLANQLGRSIAPEELAALIDQLPASTGTPGARLATDLPAGGARTRPHYAWLEQLPPAGRPLSGQIPPIPRELLPRDVDGFRPLAPRPATYVWQLLHMAPTPQIADTAVRPIWLGNAGEP